MIKNLHVLLLNVTRPIFRILLNNSIVFDEIMISIECLQVWTVEDERMIILDIKKSRRVRGVTLAALILYY